MVWQLFLLIFLLLIIFLISKNLLNLIYSFILKIFKNKKTAVWILALLFLPGTVIHEISHLITALFLRVPTGPISIFPSTAGDSPLRGQSPTDSGTVPFRVKMGHIMIAKTDPIRLTIIGVAPMIVGLVIIYFLGNSIWQGFTLTESRRNLFLAIEIYFLFITSVTMFSSKQDLKSLLITLPFTILIFSALYFSGIKITIEKNILDKITRVFSILNRNFILTAIVNYTVLIILTGGRWLWSRRLRRFR